MSKTGLMMEDSHFEVGINAVADAFAGTVNSDVVSMKNHDSVRFIVHWGVGTTGSTTLTVEACDDVTPTTTSAIPFFYRKTVGAAAPGAITAVASTGILTTVGSNQIYECEVRADALDAAGLGYGFVRLHAVESANDPLLGGILIQMGKARIAGPTPVTATA